MTVLINGIEGSNGVLLARIARDAGLDDVMADAVALAVLGRADEERLIPSADTARQVLEWLDEAVADVNAWVDRFAALEGISRDQVVLVANRKFQP